jgi:acetyltransferase-like isoleucine patch superfamily enzyme
MGLGLLRRFYKLIGKDYYISIHTGLLLLNYVVQRIFRVNHRVPFSVHYTSTIKGIENMKLAENVKIVFAVSAGCSIQAFDNTTLEIGENTIWATNVTIITANHELTDRKKYIVKSVRIGKNCWLGNGVTILPGVELGDNVTVGANSVVTKSFGPNVVIAGCPARIIKTLE